MGTRQPDEDDRRVKRTRRALREAFVDLVVERGWDGFNVQDLCARADVGRSTFYLHYADKEEVLNGAFAELGAGLRAQLAPGRSPRPLGFSRGLLDHAHGHLRAWRALVGRRAAQVVQGRMRAEIAALVRDDLAARLAPGTRRDAASAFLSGALGDLLFWSLDAKPALTVDQADALFHELAAPALAAAGAPPHPSISAQRPPPSGPPQ